MASPPVFEADHWRIRSDTTAAEGGTPVWVTDEDDADALSWDIGVTFRIRFVISEVSGNAANNHNLAPQYQINAEGWNNIGDNGTTAEGVIFDTAASSSNDNATISTKLLSVGQGTGADGRYFEDTAQQNNIDVPDGNQFSEYEWGCILDGDNTNAVEEGDTITFRLIQSGSPITVNYTNVPTITVPLSGPSGDLDATEPQDTASITGDVLINGDLDATEASDTSSIFGSVLIQGDLDATEAADSVAITGEVLSGVEGDLDATEATDISVISGSILVQGDIAYTETSDSASFDGDVINFGQINATESLDTVEFDGIILIDGDLLATEARDLVSFDGSIAISGDIDATEAADISSIIGATIQERRRRIFLTRKRGRR